MISRSYVATMAAYNRWQNASLFGAADLLSDAERRKMRGAFFGSIHRTLNHVLWGDRIWMNRFAGTPMPRTSTIADSVNECGNWSELCDARVAMDTAIEAWARLVEPDWLEGDVSWPSSITPGKVSKPAGLLVVHLFNHQTHHRGQVHAMLTSAGAQPEATDIWLMPPIDPPE